MSVLSSSAEADGSGVLARVRNLCQLGLLRKENFKPDTGTKEKTRYLIPFLDSTREKITKNLRGVQYFKKKLKIRTIETKNFCDHLNFVLSLTVTVTLSIYL